jgi:hypothetical protein
MAETQILAVRALRELLDNPGDDGTAVREVDGGTT